LCGARLKGFECPKQLRPPQALPSSYLREFRGLRTRRVAVVLFSREWRCTGAGRIQSYNPVVHSVVDRSATEYLKRSADRTRRGLIVHQFFKWSMSSAWMRRI